MNVYQKGLTVIFCQKKKHRWEAFLKIQQRYRTSLISTLSPGCHSSIYKTTSRSDAVPLLPFGNFPKTYLNTQVISSHWMDLIKETGELRSLD